MASLDSVRYVVADDVVSEVLDGQTVLLNLGRGLYFSLNETGTSIWKSLGEHGTAAAALRAVCASFDISEERARADVEALLSQLEHEGLIRRADATSVSE